MRKQTEFIELINQVNSIFEEADSLSDETQKTNFLKQHASILSEFKRSLNQILPTYLIKSNNFGDADPNQVSSNCKKCVIELISNAKLLVPGQEYGEYIKSIIDSIYKSDEKFVFNLKKEFEYDVVRFPTEYIEARNEFLHAIKEHNDSNGDIIPFLESKNDGVPNFEKNVVEQLLFLLENAFLKYSDEQVEDIINYIESTDYFKLRLQNGRGDETLLEDDMFKKYCDIVVKYRSIFDPDSIKDNVVVKQMWDGKLHGSLLFCVVHNMFPYEFVDLVNEEDDDEEKSSIEKIAEHFENLGLSDDDVATIMNRVLSEESMTIDCAIFISRVDIPEDYGTFLKSEYAKKYKWLVNEDVFKLFDALRKRIRNNYEPYLPAKYYLKEIERIVESKCVQEGFIPNLITILRSDYYSPDEKQAIIDKYEKYGFAMKAAVGSKTLKFSESDSNHAIKQKILWSYYSGQIIPLGVAQWFLKEALEHPESVDDRKLLHPCIQSIINNMLKENGVDIGNRIFFGHSYEDGYSDVQHRCIWINYSYIDKFLDAKSIFDRVQIFDTMAHESEHTLLDFNKRNGIIDYKTYCFIKEDVIKSFDKDYYKKFYYGIFEEADVRKEAIIGSLEMVAQMNPELSGALVEEFKENYNKECEQYSIRKNSKRDFPIGFCNVITVSDYLGRLIKHNPQILEKNVILKIEYNPDGSRKDIPTMLKEFKEQHNENDLDYENIYSIYRGIIEEQLPIYADDELKKEVNEFMHIGDYIVTVDDMERLMEVIGYINNYNQNAARRMENDCADMREPIEGEGVVSSEPTA